MKLSLLTAGAALLAFMALPGDPKIHSAVFNGDGTITIRGRKLLNSVVRLNNETVAIISNTAHEIVADLPGGLEVGGCYTLEVEALNDGNGQVVIDDLTYVKPVGAGTKIHTTDTTVSFGASIQLPALTTTTRAPKVVVTLDGRIAPVSSGIEAIAPGHATFNVKVDSVGVGGVDVATFDLFPGTFSVTRTVELPTGGQHTIEVEVTGGGNGGAIVTDAALTVIELAP